jgi:hypothetical protein
MKSVNLYVTKPHLSDVEKKRRRAGVWSSKNKLKSKLWISPDFDASLPPDLLTTFLGFAK